jgi:hypothetical protein
MKFLSVIDFDKLLKLTRELQLWYAWFGDFAESDR